MYEVSIDCGPKIVYKQLKVMPNIDLRESRYKSSQNDFVGILHEYQTDLILRTWNFKDCTAQLNFVVHLIIKIKILAFPCKILATLIIVCFDIY